MVAILTSWCISPANHGSHRCDKQRTPAGTPVQQIFQTTVRRSAPNGMKALTPPMWVSGDRGFGGVEHDCYPIRPHVRAIDGLELPVQLNSSSILKTQRKTHASAISNRSHHAFPVSPSNLPTSVPEVAPHLLRHKEWGSNQSMSHVLRHNSGSADHSHTIRISPRPSLRFSELFGVLTYAWMWTA